MKGNQIIAVIMALAGAILLYAGIKGTARGDGSTSYNPIDVVRHLFGQAASLAPIGSTPSAPPPSGGQTAPPPSVSGGNTYA